MDKEATIKRLFATELIVLLGIEFVYDRVGSLFMSVLGLLVKQETLLWEGVRIGSQVLFRNLSGFVNL